MLVIVATDDSALQLRVSQEAQRRCVPVNVVELGTGPVALAVQAVAPVEVHVSRVPVDVGTVVGLADNVTTGADGVTDRL